MTLRKLDPARFPWFDHTRYSFSLGLAAGGRTYLSGHTAATHDPASGKMVIRGGMTEQARTAYDKAQVILESDGQSFADAVRVVEYITPRGMAHYADARAVRHAVLGANRPAVCTVPVKALLRPDALIEIEVTTGTPGAVIAAGAGAADDAVVNDSAGLVLLPTLYPIDGNGVVVGGQDPDAQAHAILDNAARLLDGLGLGLDRIVKIVTYALPTAASRYHKIATVYRQRLGPVLPAAACLLMPRLLRSGALLQMDIIASRDAPVPIQIDGSIFYERGCSPAVRCGKLLFISGQAALDPTSGASLHDGDVVGQASCAYRNLFDILDRANARIDNLVKTIEYTTPAAMPEYRAVAGVRTELLHSPYPASTGPLCEAMLHPQSMFEIDATAVLD